MFVPQTSRIRKLANYYPRIPADLDRILGSSKNGLYIDYANVRNWSNDLGWNTDVKRLRQLFMSFTATQIHRFYYGRIEGDDASSDFLRDVEAYEIGRASCR